MLVTRQRFGDLFLFGLISQYSSNHKTYNEGRFKVTCSINKLSAHLYYSNFQLHFRWKFLVQVLWKSEFWMNVKFIFFVINDPCRIFNPEEWLFFTSLIWQKCLKFTEPKSSDINKRELRYTIKGTYQNMSKSRKNVFYLPT